MHQYRVGWALLLSISVMCCTPTTNSDPLAPPGIAKNQTAVDGLTVGHNLMQSGEYELALKAYRREIIEQGLNVDVLNGMGVANMRLGRMTEAERLLRAAVEQDRDFGPGWNNLGVLLAETSRFVEARRCFEIAFGLNGGRSQQIKANIAKTVATIEETQYTVPQEQYDFELVRRGDGVFLLLETPD